jgi:hypothetical protein
MEFCSETRFSLLASRDSRYRISVCKTREKQVSLLILTGDSRENLARILGLKSESRFSREFQKVILVSTLIIDHTRRGGKMSSLLTVSKIPTAIGRM